jgi:hypothetical protein
LTRLRAPYILISGTRPVLPSGPKGGRGDSPSATQSIRRVPEGNARECGAAVDTRQVHFDLERKPPSATWYDKNGEEIDPLTLQVSATDHEVIDIYAYTFREEVEWVLEVSYTSAGKDGILRIDDHGKPFVLIALGNAVGYLYAGDPAGLEREPDLDRPAQEGELVC